ncbi:MAG: sulfite exporter TauE/SafE family protein [Candidatus Riflebacteria bacterium]|nr:sulfite exporter TauE/SafE family protein [Candidatus Riflebacteria bacterium]
MAAKGFDRPPVGRFLVSVVVLVVWALYLALGPGFAFLQDLWPVSATMAFGSFVAGATAEGGGAVAFPVFTKVLHLPASTARDFALAIQSVGMTCGALLIARSGYRFLEPVFWWTLAGAAPAVLVGLTWVAPLVVPPYPKIFFTMFTLAFGGFLVWMNRRPRILRTRVACDHGRRRLEFVAAGVVGGLAASIVGSGADVVLFILLCLRYDVDEKVGTRTTVFLMAAVSLIGFGFLALSGRLAPAVWPMWLAAVPIVAFGAPLGALFCSWQKREHVVGFLIGLILLEFATTVWLVPFDASAVGFSAAFLATAFVAMLLLRESRLAPPDSEIPAGPNREGLPSPDDDPEGPPALEIGQP